MSKRKAHKLCSIQMAKWKNALVFHDRIRESVNAIGSDYQDARIEENVLTTNDCVVGNVSMGTIESQVCQANSVIVARDAMNKASEDSAEFGRFVNRIFSLGWIKA